MNTRTLNLIATAALAVLASSAACAADTMSKFDYKAAKENIGLKYENDRLACGQMSGNARDVCMEEAKGEQKVARAELEAKNEPSDKHSYEARMARADSAFAVSKEKCDDHAGNAKDVCRKEAEKAHVNAVADAKLALKTADANSTARDKNDAANAAAAATTKDARKDASADKMAASYALAKQKCDAMAGDAKTTCLADAKNRYQP